MFYLRLFMIITLLFSTTLWADQIYRIELMRAAPGQLSPLIEQLTAQIKQPKKKQQKIHLARHSQGDHWDLMLIQPIVSFSDYYQSKAYQHYQQAILPIQKQFSAWRETVFMQGPTHQQFQQLIGKRPYLHIEMFVALQNHHQELVHEREMENTFLTLIGSRENSIFTKLEGASWDVMTIGFYDDLKEFARLSDVDSQLEQQAAIKAGFEDITTISTYLRALINRHNDTLARRIIW